MPSEDGPVELSKLLILCEGQTEERFVQRLLVPHLRESGKFITPILLTTRRHSPRGKGKGGVSSYSKIRRDLQNLLRDTSARLVTTMLDYHRLPHDFPAMAALPSGSLHERIVHLEKAWANDIGDDRFLPYLSSPEFEALLLSSPEVICEHFGDLERLQEFAFVQEFASPEEVNDNPNTHPSRRILNIFPAYRKAKDGPLIAEKIGLATIRQKCPHFNCWLAALEAC
jgi:hypothetical protein